MSVNKFKVGDKVRVCDLAIDNGYCSETHPFNDVINSEEKIFTISDVDGRFCKIEGCDLYWLDTVLEPVEKTLENLCVGDFIRRGDTARRVLAVIGDCYLVSVAKKYTAADEWYTASELAEYGFKPVDRENTIEIDGKKYKKADVEEAIKDLEFIG